MSSYPLGALSVNRSWRSVICESVSTTRRPSASSTTTCPPDRSSPRGALAWSRSLRTFSGPLRRRRTFERRLHKHSCPPLSLKIRQRVQGVEFDEGRGVPECQRHGDLPRLEAIRTEGGE